MDTVAQSDREPGEVTRADQGRRTGSDLEKKYPIALALFAGTAVGAWFTVGEGSVIVLGRPVQIRLIAVVIFGLFAFRTYVAMQADRIRREKE